MDPATPATPAPLLGVDLGAVPPQPAVVATRCPVRADLDHSPAMAEHKSALDPSEVLRSQQTRDHVAEVWAAVAAPAATDPSVVVIEAGSPDHAIEQTRAAIVGSARVIVGARLPTDVAARRLGRATLLVRRNHDPRSGWVPVEVRRHAFTRPANGGGVTTSPLHDPHPDSAELVLDTGFRANRHNENGIQLAHQWRLLEAMGAVGPDERATGGLIDRTGTLYWVDLEERRCVTRWSPEPVSMLAHYDHGFGFRLEVIANRLAREADPEVAPRVVPVRIGQCSTCPWDLVCRTELEAIDHVSLLPRSTFDHYRSHSARGITTRAQLAQLHWPTAHLMHGPHPRAAPVDLVALQEVVAPLPPHTPIDHVFRPPERPDGHHAVQLHLVGLEPEGYHDPVVDEPLDPDDPVNEVDDEEAGAHTDGEHDLLDERQPLVPRERIDQVIQRFRGAGIHTVADLSVIDPLTASYSGVPCGHLPSVIDQARAAVADRPFLARGLGRPQVRRADVEVDVDMENVEEGVYLWGTLVSGSARVLTTVGVAAGYQPFYSWGPMTPTAQAEVFGRFWHWLSALRHACRQAGLTFAAYCYTSAEHQKMLQILSEAPPGADLPTRHDVDAFVGSEEWIDLYDVVRSSLVVGHGLGLKRIAPLAGFRWRDDDAGGLQSMTWHREVVDNPDPAVRAENRSRLLVYNEDDVRATHAVREWLSTAPIPSIEDWEPDLGTGA